MPDVPLREPDHLAADRRAQILEHWRSACEQYEATTRITSEFVSRSVAFAQKRKRQLAAAKLRILICTKLGDGRLPLKRPAVIPGEPGHGDRCDACDEVLLPRQLAMQIQTFSGRSVYLHADCFIVWDTARRVLADE